MNKLTRETITFGKYKGKELKIILKDRPYCKWLIKQKWFEDQYGYLFNRVNTYCPEKFFLNNRVSDINGFVNTYPYFNLKPINDIEIKLTSSEKLCYEYYKEVVNNIRNKILKRIDENNENIYNIKAPTKWLLTFENKYDLKRVVFKEFIKSYDLKNVTKIIEDIKSEGNIEYKGDKAYLIAKEKSIEQESFWSNILKNNFGEDISEQFKFKKCIFDFINIKTNTIYECKLGLKDFNIKQYKKYLLTLDNYRIIYLFDRDCIVDMNYSYIYTTNKDKYESYLGNIKETKLTVFEKIIKEFNILNIENIELGLIEPN